MFHSLAAEIISSNSQNLATCRCGIVSARSFCCDLIVRPSLQIFIPPPPCWSIVERETCGHLELGHFFHTSESIKPKQLSRVTRPLVGIGQLMGCNANISECFLTLALWDWSFFGWLTSVFFLFLFFFACRS